MPLIIDWLKIVVSVEVITLADYLIDLGKILWAVARGVLGGGVVSPPPQLF
jgi:hypothetical protein